MGRPSSCVVFDVEVHPARVELAILPSQGKRHIPCWVQSRNGGIRTLSISATNAARRCPSQSGLPVAYVPESATHTGFEPVISTVTGWRPLQTGLMGRVSFVFVAEAPSRFELAQDVLQTSSAPHGLVPMLGLVVEVGIEPT